MPLKKLYLQLNDPVALIGLSRSGVSYAIFQHIVSSSPLTTLEWSGILHLTSRTLQRYKKEKRTFEQPYSERILEIAQLQKRGIEVFGDLERYNKWLESDIVALGGVKPKTLLDNSFGIDLLGKELTRIEYGVLA